ncbi:sigma 54-interacting transcriptional regulator [Hydrogenophaga sp. PAMC20947]|uniref:sigma 54-interacting transcriptional regulator n=1 Tax=Hydrogenophaga sp. PAMC20947 TaxID=2565558 RepID=UPI00109D8E94|nr:sigma 54-interacting transcriptional regulator [Hydrogenophaga sp. PAMC20947]QCB46896.1 sigma-54-dependent Fis family transcriptional regulator [Hydrogenophaga sp. PAMC20947]
MAIPAWLRFLGDVPVDLQAPLMSLFHQAGIDTSATPPPTCMLGIAVLAQPDEHALNTLRELCQGCSVLAVAVGDRPFDPAAMWRVLDAGATDLLLWHELPPNADEGACRLQRWQTIRALVESDTVRQRVAGSSCAWQSLIRDVVEVARLTQSAVLITGETGTGKEQVANLIHELDGREDVGEFVVVDCTTLSAELSGSEFFGHERGAFTGAAGARDGAFAMAHRGTLFLDEVGELSAALQAQLLRVVQERQYKRLGSNTWQRSDFRLICATHRDLEAAVAEGTFRADLYYRIAAWRCTTPPLRERLEDIIPLVHFMLEQLDARAAQLEMDPAVKQYLLTREYPGNVRDLRQTVARLWQRHSGDGPLTVGDVPEHERPSSAACRPLWPDRHFDDAVRHAVELGIGLKEIGQIAAELATQAALDQEGGNLQRAAARLGVTDRALQIRRANQRAAH